MARLAADALARRGDVFGVFFGVIMSECVDRFALRLAAHFARARSLSLGFATGCNCFSPFTPSMSGRNDLALGCAAHFTFTGTLAVIRACSRRGVSPFAPCVRVFPYRIQRYVGAHRVGQDIPHLLAGCVERKADKPRTLLSRKSELSYDLSVLDRNVRKRTAALRVECHNETYCFITGIFTAGIISRSFGAGILTARSLLSGSAAVVAGGEDADGEDKAARQRDDEKQLPFHAYLPRAKNRPRLFHSSPCFRCAKRVIQGTPNIAPMCFSAQKIHQRRSAYMIIALFCRFSMLKHRLIATDVCMVHTISYSMYFFRGGSRVFQLRE